MKVKQELKSNKTFFGLHYLIYYLLIWFSLYIFSPLTILIRIINNFLYFSTNRFNYYILQGKIFSGYKLYHNTTLKFQNLHFKYTFFIIYFL